jgi:serine/threonine protein kinase
MLGRIIREAIGHHGVIMHATVVVSKSGEEYTTTQHERVVKVMSSAVTGPDDPRREIALQERLNCDQLCKLSEVAADEHSYYLVMPFFNGGELFSRVAKAGSLPEVSCKAHMRDILRGVQHMQANNIFHGDLSLENVLLSSSNFKETSHIIDFGLAREVDGGSHTVAIQRVSGKLAYMSPEMFENTGEFDGFKADIWACGVMLFVMLVGMPPYLKPSNADANFATLISEGPSALIDSWGLADEVSPAARLLLESMLSADPAARPSADEVLGKDGWICA